MAKQKTPHKGGAIESSDGWVRHTQPVRRYMKGFEMRLTTNHYWLFSGEFTRQVRTDLKAASTDQVVLRVAHEPNEELLMFNFRPVNKRRALDDAGDYLLNYKKMTFSARALLRSLDWMRLTHAKKSWIPERFTANGEKSCWIIRI